MGARRGSGIAHELPANTDTTTYRLLGLTLFAAVRYQLR
jgi:hypothetical protein